MCKHKHIIVLINYPWNRENAHILALLYIALRTGISVCCLRSFLYLLYCPLGSENCSAQKKYKRTSVQPTLNQGRIFSRRIYIIHTYTYKLKVLKQIQTHTDVYMQFNVRSSYVSSRRILTHNFARGCAPHTHTHIIRRARIIWRVCHRFSLLARARARKQNKVITRERTKLDACERCTCGGTNDDAAVAATYKRDCVLLQFNMLLGGWGGGVLVMMHEWRV